MTMVMVIAARLHIRYADAVRNVILITLLPVSLAACTRGSVLRTVKAPPVAWTACGGA
ncbi:MAG: hypothetical protein ABI231_11685 [Candidatus Tumulicola sp.]